MLPNTLPSFRAGGSPPLTIDAHQRVVRSQVLINLPTTENCSELRSLGLRPRQQHFQEDDYELFVEQPFPFLLTVVGFETCRMYLGSNTGRATGLSQKGLSSFA